MTDPTTMAADNALMILENEPTVSGERIREVVDLTVKGVAAMGIGVPDRDEVLRRVEANVTIIHGNGGMIVGTERDHTPWLPANRATISWDFWQRYRVLLERSMPRASVVALHTVTDNILGELEQPSRPGSWSRRGLVVGQVQSGKTANYTGLVCKAADAGYQLIIVLAGIHNSLRSQTQMRLDEGFLGFDTQHQLRSDRADNSLIGVGRLGRKRPHVASLTTSAEAGDFRVTIARQAGVPLGSMPVVLVVKKHSSILNNIHSWVTSMAGHRAVPLLIIDDEADHASMNTARIDADVDPTAINRGIRKLLHAFDRSAYVGYTATPFANIFSAANEDDDDWGRDLFPESFIISLDAPSNYFGPERIFGIPANPDDPDADTVEPLPIHREIWDAGTWMPDKHKQTWNPPPTLPASLQEALLCFVLTCAARRARGQTTPHNSMLIHVTRFQSVQRLVRQQVEVHLDFVAGRLRSGEGYRVDTVRAQLRKLWETDYVPTSSHWATVENQPVTWEQVDAELLPAIERFQLRTMNGAAKDVLDYWDNRHQGLTVVAIGGDKLSRGLTLEGLTVSYFLRASTTYDTLMQMGRWFGYRAGYEDLCRLYTTRQLRSWYRDTAIATVNLRRELQEMQARGATPRQYGLRILRSPSGMDITAANKMRRAQTVRLSFSGEGPETVLFDTHPEVLDTNRQTLERFIGALGEPTERRPPGKGPLRWTAVPGSDVVAGFLQSYLGDPRAWRVRSQLIARYVQQRMALRKPELLEWTVVLISSTDRQAVTRTIAGHAIGLTRRSLLNDTDDRAKELVEDHRYAIRRILSPGHEALDLTKDQKDAALKWTQDHHDPATSRRKTPPEDPSGRALRRQRDPNSGLLLLYALDPQPDPEEPPLVSQPMVGFQVSLPHSRDPEPVEYSVNEVWQKELLDDLAGDDT